MQRKPYIFMIAVSLIVLLGVYVVSYFAMSHIYTFPSKFAMRFCDYKWMMTAYRPMAVVESFATGNDVHLAHDGRKYRKHSN